MRVAGVAVASMIALATGRAVAEPLPPGSMGVVVLGGQAGTGADAKRLGFGYVFPFLSFQAAWQPMSTERRVGWTVRWTTMFYESYSASAAQVTGLETMQMDLTVGIRIRPGSDPRRYITARAGPGLLRANQTIPPANDRAFLGAATSVGFQQYFVGTLLLLDVDVRYGLIGGPSEIAVTAGISINGP